MGTIRNLSDRFKALDFELIKQQSLIETAPQIMEMTEQQMRIGERSDGYNIIPDLQDLHYSLQKKEAGGIAPFETPDLFNTGQFYKGLRTSIGLKTINTYSLDTKAPKLEEKYTPLIYGANEINLSKYAVEDLKPVLLEKLKAATVG